MQTDRELLEMAARAAGFEVLGDEHPAEGLNVLVNGRVYTWRPRHDDGDAFKLAVKLGLHIRFWAYACEIQDAAGNEWPMVHSSDFGNDLCTATRRAIVRAAADIGRRMG